MPRIFALISIIVLEATAAHAADQPAWETITSKEGQFTVEMPEKPTVNESRVRKGADGREKTILVGCRTDAGAYFAYKVVLASSIVKGTEDAELDAARNGMAREWKGKVLQEKRIRAGKKIGRDFTVRGKPEKGEGVLTIRIRAYLEADSIFLVAVVSPPDKELPEDAGRFLGSLTLGAARVRAQGTPMPEPKGTDLPGWGLAIDPDKDCKITGEAKKLRITVPGTRHDLHATIGLLNAPRVMREVEGDFVVTLKVVGDFRPGGRSTNPTGVPFNGAGILVWSDADNYIRLERAAVARRGKVNTYVNFQEREGGTDGASHNEVMKGGDCWVRMERKGSQIHGSISFDGTTWKELKPIQTVWPAKLKIGVTAVNSSSLPFSVAFEEYQLKGRRSGVSVCSPQTPGCR